MGPKSGKCAHLCSMCNVTVDAEGSPRALEAQDRECLRMLKQQLELCQRLRSCGPRNPSDIDADSMRAVVPALAVSAGLSTPPFLFYKIIGFDALHVCSLLRLGVCPSSARCAFWCILVGASPGMSEFPYWRPLALPCSSSSCIPSIFLPCRSWIKV